MPIIPHVSSSAIHPSAYSSPAVRKEQVQALCDDFSSWLINFRKEKLRKGGDQIFPEEIQDRFDKTLAGVRTEVKSSSFLDWGSTSIIEENGSVVGYKFSSCVPSFCKNLLNYFTVAVLSHEHAHIADFAINPEKVASGPQVHKMFASKIDVYEEIADFYLKNIYETNGFGSCSSREPLTLPSLSTEERIGNLRKSIVSFFSGEGFTKDEKMLLLSKWESNVSSEHVAYNEELKALIKLRKHLGEAPPFEQLSKDEMNELVRYIEKRAKVTKARIYAEKQQLLSTMSKAISGN